MKHAGLKRYFFSAVLAVILAAGLMPLLAFAETASGQQEETPLAEAESAAPSSGSQMTTQWYYGPEKELTGLGTKGISNPQFANGGWNKVYFGGGDTPLVFNVLNTHETCFGGDTMFLDCPNTILNGAPGGRENEFFKSDLNNYLNGEFFQQRFNGPEQDAIASSFKVGLAPGDGLGWIGAHGEWMTEELCPVYGSRVFILDARELTNESYGFTNPGKTTKFYTNSFTREKTGTASEWWTRTQWYGWGYSYVTVLPSGQFTYEHHNSDKPIGVSPCLNVKLSSILYTSPVDTNTYKLTVRDNNLKLNVGDATKSYPWITVPYSVTGDCNILSVLMTDAEWTDSGWSNPDADFIYQNINTGPSGTCSFRYDVLDDHPDYNIYLIAEQRNGDHETDFASAPVKLTFKQRIARIANGYIGTYDGKPHGIYVDVTNPWNGATVKYGTTNGTYDLDASPTATDVTETPLRVYYQITADGYFTTTDRESVTILPANPKIPTGVTAYYGEPLRNASLPDGWSWDDGASDVGDLGTRTFLASYTPPNKNYNPMSGVAVPVTVVERNHDWGSASYEWSFDNSSVTAKRSCPVCGIEETETASASPQVTKQPTCSAMGETTYTATFANEDFKTQTKTVQDIAVNSDAHNWGEWEQTAAPTCEVKGAEKRVCSRNPNHIEIREIAALGHDWRDSKTYVEDEDHFNCSRWCVREGCNKRYNWTEPVEGHVHAPGLVEGKDATCETAGTVQHYLCANCGHRYTDMSCSKELSENAVYIPPKGHEWGAWSQIELSTCSSNGKSERVCTRDSSHKETRTDAIDPYAHKWGEWKQTTAPTCTKAGEDTRVCAHDSSHTEKRVGAAATEHDWGEPVYTWANDNASVTATRACKSCGDREVEIAATTSNVTQKPTCSSKGKTTYTATFNKESFAAQSKSIEDIGIDPEGHEWGGWAATAYPTCTKVGTEERVCALDPSHKESREIAVDPEAHIWSDWTQKTAPTCKGTGTEERVCALDPSHMESREIPVNPEGHVWSDWTYKIAPTCEEAGTEERVCALDGSHMESRMAAPLGHDWKETGWAVGEGDVVHMKRECQREGCGKVVEWEYNMAEGHVHALALVPFVGATCENPGTVEHYLCAECLHRFTSLAHDEELTDAQVWIAPLGHVWGEWAQTTAPTCTKAGEETRVCALDPSHKESRKTAVDPNAHNWGAWTTIKAATKTKGGVEQRVCKNDASHVETRATSKLEDTSGEKTNPLKVTAKKTIKANAAKTTKVKKAITIKAAQGKVAVKTNNKKVKVAVKKNMKNGKTYKLKITVKKGLKKGKAYKVKVRIKAAGNAEYKPAAITKTIKVKVR